MLDITISLGEDYKVRLQEQRRGENNRYAIEKERVGESVATAQDCCRQKETNDGRFEKFDGAVVSMARVLFVVTDFLPHVFCTFLSFVAACLLYVESTAMLSGMSRAEPTIFVRISFTLCCLNCYCAFNL